VPGLAQAIRLAQHLDDVYAPTIGHEKLFLTAVCGRRKIGLQVFTRERDDLRQAGVSP
jgi:hypothetical protein